MACETVNLAAQQRRQREEMLADLKRRLATGQASLVIGPKGGIGIKGWKSADAFMSDGCALRKILNSPEGGVVRRAIAAAEARFGVKADTRTLNAHGHGEHTHDGGKTWGDHS